MKPAKRSQPYPATRRGPGSILVYPENEGKGCYVCDAFGAVRFVVMRGPLGRVWFRICRDCLEAVREASLALRDEPGDPIPAPKGKASRPSTSAEERIPRSVCNHEWSRSDKSSGPRWRCRHCSASRAL